MRTEPPRSPPIAKSTSPVATSAALTKNIDKLVSREVNQRTTDELDNRRLLVFISDFGLEVVARLKERADAHHETIEEALCARKTSQLKKLLENFIAESQPN